MATTTTDWIYPNSVISQAANLATDFNFGTSGITAEPWSNPNLICNEDGTLSSNNIAKGSITYIGYPVELPVYYSILSDWLICNFSSLNLPSTANNIRIDVIVKRKASIADKIFSGYTWKRDPFNPIPNGGSIFLYNGNTRLGFTTTSQAWGTTSYQESFGGSSSTFDDSITAEILNSGNFKIRFLCENYDTNSARTAYIDTIKFRVTYDYIESGPANLKTFNGTQASNIKTRNGLNQINIKTVHGV